MNTFSMGPSQSRKSIPQQWPAMAALLLCTFIWGFSFVIVKKVLEVIPVFYFNALRFTVAAVSLGPLALRERRRWKAALIPGLVMSLFLYAGFALQATGLQYTTPSKSAFIAASVPGSR